MTRKATIAALRADIAQLRADLWRLPEDLDCSRAHGRVLQAIVDRQDGTILALWAMIERAEAELAKQKHERDEWMERAEQAEADIADCAKTCGGLEYRLKQAEAEVVRLNGICDRLAAAGHRGDE